MGNDRTHGKVHQQDSVSTASQDASPTQEMSNPAWMPPPQPARDDQPQAMSNPAWMPAPQAARDGQPQEMSNPAWMPSQPQAAQGQPLAMASAPSIQAEPEQKPQPLTDFDPGLAALACQSLGFDLSHVMVSFMPELESQGKLGMAQRGNFIGLSPKILSTYRDTLAHEIVHIAQHYQFHSKKETKNSNPAIGVEDEAIYGSKLILKGEKLQIINTINDEIMYRDDSSSGLVFSADFDRYMEIIDNIQKKEGYNWSQTASSMRKIFYGSFDTHLSAESGDIVNAKEIINKEEFRFIERNKSVQIFPDENIDMPHVFAGIEAYSMSSLSWALGLASDSILSGVDAISVPTWAGDVGSALGSYCMQELLESASGVDKQTYYTILAGEDQLLGDIDGINIGSDLNKLLKINHVIHSFVPYDNNFDEKLSSRIKFYYGFKKEMSKEPDCVPQTIRFIPFLINSDFKWIGKGQSATLSDESIELIEDSIVDSAILYSATKSENWVDGIGTKGLTMVSDDLPAWDITMGGENLAVDGNPTGSARHYFVNRFVDWINKGIRNEFAPEWEVVNSAISKK
jgi:hypothetical protein